MEVSVAEKHNYRMIEQYFIETYGEQGRFRLMYKKR